MLDITEEFNSIQGEGKNIGKPAYFIRLAKCNLRCSWCDSKYSWKEGTKKTIDEILDNIPEDKLVVITGGEPLLQKEVYDLVKRIKNPIEIETNGTIYRPELIGYAKFNVSPKLQYLDEEYKETLKKWSNQATFKYVIKYKEDFDEAKELSDELDVKDVILMPRGIDSKEILIRTKQLVEWTIKEFPRAQVIPRLHILLYENKRGK